MAGDCISVSAVTAKPRPTPTTASARKKHMFPFYNVPILVRAVSVKETMSAVLQAMKRGQCLLLVSDKSWRLWSQLKIK